MEVKRATAWQVTAPTAAQQRAAQVPALAFVFDDVDDDAIGELVQGGDWRGR
jgi:hypothetical protein